MFLGKCVLKICSKYAWEHPCRSMISVKLQSNFTEITLLHGCSSVNLLHIFYNTFSQEHRWRAAFAVISDLFGVWKALAIETFNHRIKEIVAHFNNNYVKMPEFYVYISSKRRSFNGFKHQYSVSTVAFVGYSKRFWILQLEHQVARTMLFETYRIPKDNGRSVTSKQNRHIGWLWGNSISRCGWFCISKVLLAG